MRVSLSSPLVAGIAGAPAGGPAQAQQTNEQLKRRWTRRSRPSTS